MVAAPRDGAMNGPPPWLVALIANEYFDICRDHYAPNKTRERKFCCFDCCSDGLCNVCLVEHSGHHVIQIRKCSYSDAVRVNDFNGLFDLTGIQTYIINNARIVFLREREHSRATSKVFTSFCKTCNRALNDHFVYCSVGCKVADAVRLGTKAVPLVPPSSKPLLPPTTINPQHNFFLKKQQQHHHPHQPQHQTSSPSADSTLDHHHHHHQYYTSAHTPLNGHAEESEHHDLSDDDAEDMAWEDGASGYSSPDLSPAKIVRRRKHTLEKQHHYQDFAKQCWPLFDSTNTCASLRSPYHQRKGVPHRSPDT